MFEDWYACVWSDCGHGKTYLYTEQKCNQFCTIGAFRGGDWGIAVLCGQCMLIQSLNASLFTAEEIEINELIYELISFSFFYIDVIL